LAEAIAGVNRRLNVKGFVAFDARNEADRANAIAKTIGVNLNLLSESERARFAELAVFPEDVDVPLGVVARLWHETGGIDEFDTEDLLQRLQNLSLLLSLDLERRTFRFHDTVRHFLQEQAGKEALAALHKRLLKALDGIDADAGADEASRRYYYLYRPEHLGLGGEWDERMALLLDPGWLQAKLNAVGDPFALLADYERFGHGDTEDLIYRTLRLASGICIRDKRQLLPQLHGRLMSRRLARPFCKEARRLVARPGILTLRPSLTPPGAELARLEGHRHSVRSLALLADGRLASGSLDRTIRLWDLKTGQETTRLEDRDGLVTSLIALSGDRLASGCFDKSIKLWNLASGAEAARLEGHRFPAWALALLPDGRLASGSFDKTIRLWDVDTGQETARLEDRDGLVTCSPCFPATVSLRALPLTSYGCGTLRPAPRRRGSKATVVR
jgi:hypothetical protein